MLCVLLESAASRIQWCRSYAHSRRTMSSPGKHTTRDPGRKYFSWATSPDLYVDDEFFGRCDITIGVRFSYSRHGVHPVVFKQPPVLAEWVVNHLVVINRWCTSCPARHVKHNPPTPLFRVPYHTRDSAHVRRRQTAAVVRFDLAVETIQIESFFFGGYGVQYWLPLWFLRKEGISDLVVLFQCNVWFQCSSTCGEVLLEIKVAFKAMDSQKLVSWRPVDPNHCDWEGVPCAFLDLTVRSMWDAAGDQADHQRHGW